MSQLFGFQINRKEKGRGQSPVPPNADDGVNVAAGGYFGTYVETDAQARNEYDLIKRYRDMSLHPECDSAIDDIVNEFVVSDSNDTCVNIDLTNLQVGASVKKRIREEFEYIKRLLNFDMRAHELIRNWYVDGRTYYHKVIDLKDPGKGITELRYIDPLKIRRVRQKIKKVDQVDPLAIRGTALEHEWGDYVDYYVYNPKGYGRQSAMIGTGDFSSNQGIKIAFDAITYVHSGLQDMNKRMHLSFLHKGIKSLNQLRMIEDALVIYRLSRAPERRIFYIDVGNLPKVKAEQYLRDVMARYRNKLVYDAATGEIRDDKKHMSMLEDFWLPRREGGRGTEITTLPGGANLGEIDDIVYFQRKLYRSLNVPMSRMEAEQNFSLGRSTEITRDELKFSKFVQRLRKKFSALFHDILRTQLVLTGVIAEEEWDKIKEHIQYDFLQDGHFAELRDSEILRERLEMLGTVEPYVGNFFSKAWVRKHILHQTQEEIDEIENEIENEGGGEDDDMQMSHKPKGQML